MSEMIVLKIVSPDGLIFESGKVNSIEVPTETGVITIYHDHKNLVSKISFGEVIIESEGESYRYFTDDGLLTIDQASHVSLIVDHIVKVEDIDVSLVEMEIEKIEEELINTNDIEEVELLKLQLTLKREKAKLMVAKKY